MSRVTQGALYFWARTFLIAGGSWGASCPIYVGPMRILQRSRSLQSWASTIQSFELTADVFRNSFIEYYQVFVRLLTNPRDSLSGSEYSHLFLKNRLLGEVQSFSRKKPRDCFGAALTVFRLLFFHPIVVFARLFSLPPSIRSRNSDPGHIAGSSPPSSLRFMTCIFVARRRQLFSSLLDSRPTVACTSMHSTPSSSLTPNPSTCCQTLCTIV